MSGSAREPLTAATVVGLAVLLACGLIGLLIGAAIQVDHPHHQHGWDAPFWLSGSLIGARLHWALLPSIGAYYAADAFGEPVQLRWRIGLRLMRLIERLPNSQLYPPMPPIVCGCDECRAAGGGDPAACAWFPTDPLNDGENGGGGNRTRERFSSEPHNETVRGGMAGPEGGCVTKIIERAAKALRGN